MLQVMSKGYIWFEYLDISLRKQGTQKWHDLSSQKSTCATVSHTQMPGTNTENIGCLSEMNLKLSSSGTQMTFHYNKSYHWVSTHCIPHTIFPFYTWGNSSTEWRSWQSPGCNFNSVLDFMTDNPIESKRLDLHQVVGTYSHGSNNNMN